MGKGEGVVVVSDFQTADAMSRKCCGARTTDDNYFDVPIRLLFLQPSAHYDDPNSSSCSAESDVSQKLFRSVVSIVLTLLIPAQLVGQDLASAMVYANGPAWVNGTQIPKSVAVFPETYSKPSRTPPQHRRQRIVGYGSFSLLHQRIGKHHNRRFRWRRCLRRSPAWFRVCLPGTQRTDFGIWVPLTQAGPLAYTIAEAKSWPTN